MMLYDPKWEVPTETKPLEDWQEALIKAADYMDEHGFCQGTLVDSNGRVCILGALLRANQGGDRTRVSQAQAHLRDFLPVSIVGWNDARGRSKEEAVAALRQCASR